MTNLFRRVDAFAEMEKETIAVTLLICVRVTEILIRQLQNTNQNIYRVS